VKYWLPVALGITLVILFYPVLERLGL